MEQLRGKILKNSVIMLILIVSFAVMYLTVGGNFLSNDDMGIMKQISGYNTGIPSRYHPYISGILGAFFEKIYTLCPSVSWYSYACIATVIISLGIVISVLFNEITGNNRWIKMVWYAGIFTFVVAATLYGIYFISWTVNSAFYGVAAIMVILNNSSVSEKKEKYFKWVVTWLLLILSSLIRYASFKAILPFVVIAFIYYIIEAKRSGESWKNLIKLIIVFIIVVIGIRGYRQYDLAYKNEVQETTEHEEFERYRGYFSDYDIIPYEGNEEFYQSMGWDQEFYTMSQNWFYIDRRFNTENLKKIVDASKDLRVSTSVNNRISSAFDIFWDAAASDHVWNYLAWLLIGFCGLGFIMTIYNIVKKRSWVAWLMLFGVQLLALSEDLYLCMRGRYIFRGFICSALPALFIGVWVILRRSQNIGKSKLLLQVVLVTGSICCAYISANQYFDFAAKENRDNNNRISSDADIIYMSNPDNLYIYDNSIVSGTQLFLDMDYSGCGNNKLFWGGTGVFNKAFYDKIADFGYMEFYSDNLFDEKVFYITTDANIWDSNFMAYMRKTYGEDISVDMVEQRDSGIHVYKFLR